MEYSKEFRIRLKEEIKDTISEDENFNQLMGNILIELLANQGLEELKNGI